MPIVPETRRAVGLVATTRKSTSSRPARISWSTTTPSFSRDRSLMQPAVGVGLDQFRLVGDDRLIPIATCRTGPAIRLDVPDLEAPPGRCFPRIVNISLSQARDNARPPSSAASGARDGGDPPQADPDRHPQPAQPARSLASSLSPSRAESEGLRPAGHEGRLTRSNHGTVGIPTRATGARSSGRRSGRSRRRSCR